MMDFVPPDQPERLFRVTEVESRVVLSQGQTRILPGGAVINSDGIITYPGGAKLQFVIQNGEIIGHQVFRPDGSKLQIGETLTLPDGTILEQKQF